MALEQYFYQKIEQQQDIKDEIKLVLLRIKSVAFLNVLCNLGKKLPNLFEHSLQPLLSVPEIYYWDITIYVHGRNHLMIGSLMEGEFFFKLAQQFNQLEHRKIDLREVAKYLIFTSPTVQDFFAETIQHWELKMNEVQDDKFRDFIQQLIITFNIENYEVHQHPQYGQFFLNKQLLILNNERAEEMRRNNIDMQIRFFPIRCRQIIDEKKSLSIDELEVFWEQIQEISSMNDFNAQESNGQVIVIIHTNMSV